MQVRALSKLVAGSHLPLQRLLQRQRAMQSVDVMLEAVALLSNLQNVVLESFIKKVRFQSPSTGHNEHPSRHGCPKGMARVQRSAGQGRLGVYGVRALCVSRRPHTRA